MAEGLWRNEPNRCVAAALDLAGRHLLRGGAGVVLTPHPTCRSRCPRSQRSRRGYTRGAWRRRCWRGRTAMLRSGSRFRRSRRAGSRTERTPPGRIARLLEPLASYRLVALELTGLDKSHARVQQPSHGVLRVIAQSCLSMPVRGGPFEQLRDHRSAVSVSLMPTVDDQSADPEALIGRIDAPHHEADDTFADPNGEGAPREVSVGALNQVIGRGRNEALLRLLDLQLGACSPVVRPDLFKDHGARLLQHARGDFVGGCMTLGGSVALGDPEFRRADEPRNRRRPHHHKVILPTPHYSCSKLRADVALLTPWARDPRVRGRPAWWGWFRTDRDAHAGGPW
jgi:hypothetical protein